MAKRGHLFGQVLDRFWDTFLGKNPYNPRSRGSRGGPIFGPKMGQKWVILGVVLDPSDGPFWGWDPEIHGGPEISDHRKIGYHEKL